MKLYEVDLEDLIWDNLQSVEGIELLRKRGLDCSAMEIRNCRSSFVRQMNLGSYGVPDIVSIKDHGIDTIGNKVISVHVIELKGTEAHADHFMQLSRYISGLNHYLKSNKYVDVGVTGSLITKGYDSIQDPFFMDYLFPHVKMYSFSFDLQQGISFKEHHGGWEKIEPNFTDDFTGKSIIGDTISYQKIYSPPTESQIADKKEYEQKYTF